MERFQRPVFTLIARMVGDAMTAEDLAQETFLKAFRRLSTYDRERKFSSWLFKIAHNTAIDHLRRRRLTTVSLEAGEELDADYDPALVDPEAETPEEAAQRSDLARHLERALASLRPEYREILVLRYREGLAYNEIAEVMQVPLGTVKTHLHRARRELAVAAEAMGLGAP